MKPWAPRLQASRSNHSTTLATIFTDTLGRYGSAALSTGFWLQWLDRHYKFFSRARTCDVGPPVGEPLPLSFGILFDCFSASGWLSATLGPRFGPGLCWCDSLKWSRKFILKRSAAIQDLNKAMQRSWLVSSCKITLDSSKGSPSVVPSDRSKVT